MNGNWNLLTDDDSAYTELVTKSTLNVKKNYEKMNSKKRFPFRYLIVLVCSIATITMGFIRTCMGMAIVCMTNHTAILDHRSHSGSLETPAYCPGDSNVNESGRQFAEDGPFVWDDSVQSLILGSYFWGYIITQLPGGIIVVKIGAKWTMAVSMVISSLLCLSIPIATTHFHVAMLIIINVGIGLAQGVIYPTIYYVVSRWSPKNERTRMLTVAVSGFAISQMLVNVISANICSANPINGWKYIFYLFGLCGIISFIIWMIVMEDLPSNHRWVSINEANYIKSTSECCQRPGIKMKIPWKEIFKSPPFWACCLTELIFTFKSNALLVDLPTYMKVIMNFDIKKNGIINSVPYIIKGAIGLFMAFAGDYVISYGLLSSTGVRKISVCLIATTSIIGLVGVTVAGCQKMMVVILLAIVIGFDGFQLVGISLNALDLAPNFVGVIKGLLNVSAAIGNLAAPSIIGLMITNNNSVSSWNNFFYVTSALIGLGCFLFFIYGSGSVQPWNEIDSSSSINTHGNSEEEIDLNDESSSSQQQLRVN
ncbi:hypothetical protein CHUAL_001002 [Chamberlinius hualienensis]